MFSPVVVIPVYNHPATVGAVVEGALRHGLPCILVDDASTADCANVLDILQARHNPLVTLVRLARNHGKGGAMLAGFAQAMRQGHSHALQIDADGQHDGEDIPRFVVAARAAPSCVINGQPVYDDSVPKLRLYGRYATHLWVWINTLSLDIRDSMCGFRMYPLAALAPLLGSTRIGQRMDFDSDIIVRLHWSGVRVVNLPTRVHYPKDGISHFRMWQDNVLISAMHTRHFFGMLRRAPMLLWHKFRRPA